jgi:acetyltransferase-like isoleucine patch superfamily enzyme
MNHSLILLNRTSQLRPVDLYCRHTLSRRGKGKSIMSLLYALIGCGGFGREVAPLVRSMLEARCPFEIQEFVFATEAPEERTINGIRVIQLDEFLSHNGERKFNIAIADSQARERIAVRCLSVDAKPFEIVASSTRFLGSNLVGEGSIFCDFTMVTSNARIGRFFHANIYSYVAHDCVVGDFVTFAPGVKCNGNVTIGNHVYIG